MIHYIVSIARLRYELLRIREEKEKQLKRRGGSPDGGGARRPADGARNPAAVRYRERDGSSTLRTSEAASNFAIAQTDNITRAQPALLATTCNATFLDHPLAWEVPWLPLHAQTIRRHFDGASSLATRSWPKLVVVE